jgi:Spy/CpxP family protein refolding chaperone
MNEQTTGPGNETGAKPRHRRWFLGGLVAGGLLGGLAATSATVWSHGGFGGCGGPRGPGAAAFAGERAEFATDWMLGRIEASEEQRNRVKSIVKDTMQELAPLREQHRANREAMREALQQPKVDREALERLRRAGMELADGASSRIVRALADASEVLTPEQRGRLAEYMLEHRRWRHRL